MALHRISATTITNYRSLGGAHHGKLVQAGANARLPSGRQRLRPVACAPDGPRRAAKCALEDRQPRRAWSRPKERYADLRSRARTPEADKLIALIRDGIELLERRGAKRVRKRRKKWGAEFSEAVERFVGDCFARRPGPAGRFVSIVPQGKAPFSDDPVEYDLFCKMLEGLYFAGAAARGSRIPARSGR